MTHGRAAILGLALALPCGAVAQTAEPVRLVLQITVDQLRGDLPLRYLDRFGDSGFRLLLENGTVYTDGHHAHANTETIVGHTTLATGAHPAAHGMIGNVWFDHETGFTTYNIEDPRYRLVSAGADVDAETEIDPTQRAARSEGRSPASILVSTFSDELAIRTAGRARIFGVSIKDRGAVSMAGHAGKAFWFSKASGEFVTSTYYYDAYPRWVDDWNARGLPASYGGTTWNLPADRSTFLFGDEDDREWETDLAGFGRTFPHDYGPAVGRYFSTLLTTSPAGDALTLDFTKALIVAEQLGTDEVTDYLGVSFSSTDYVGHLFGPSSLESEVNLLHLDGVLADLFAFVDEHVGLDRTLIVLSSDHGGPEVPGYLAELGVPAGYVEPDEWDRAPAIAALEERFGVGEALIETYAHPYVYLDNDVVDTSGLERVEVEEAIAEELMKFPGVALALSSTALRRGAVAEMPLTRSVMNNFNPTRSGDVFVVFEPHWFINDFDGLTVASHHGSPWRYDTFVPLIFSGPGVPARTVHRRVHTIDLAPTLARFVGTGVPSGATGTPLVEVLAGRGSGASARRDR
ncbi:MAG: alkaline phosphatase family protein [Gemmatimonadota bacterium]|nr:alkaline phosphatase family protein [Gemmatimonadota bacterium]